MPISTDDHIRASLEEAVGEQYSIIRLLGRGGMGAVYLAHDRSLDRTVAIKVLPPEVATTVGRERFRREARTAAKLNHPNIVPLHAFGEADGMMYFVMGFVPGGSLSDRLRQLGRLPANVVRETLIAVVDALDYAHRQGVVHRDIKPDNILIDEQTGRPMLTDFGIAKGIASDGTLTGIGMPIGTPLYMSPEQASGEQDIDGRSDLYSLGVMAYALLSGRLPFGGRDVREILAQHLTRKPPPLKRVAPDVPDDLATVVMRCLAKVPNERWRDAGQMRNALQHAHGGIVEKRAWFDGLLIGTLAPTIWIVTVLTAFAGATNPEEPLSQLGLDRFLIPVTVFTPALALLLLSLPIVGLALIQSRRSGWRWTQVAQMFLRQPGWWRGWFPAPLRHPATAGTWSRLPTGLRVLYTLFDVTVIVLLFTLLPAAALLVAATPGALEAYPSFYWPFYGDIVGSRSKMPGWDAGLMWICVFAYVGTLVWAQRRGLSLGEANYVASARALAPTHEAITFWKRPHVAVLLSSPQSQDAQPTEPQSPPEYLDRIQHASSIGSLVPGELAGMAVKAAGRLVADIDAVEGEIESFKRNADAEQMLRLERKLDGMNAAGLNSDTDRQMHALLVNELELLRRVSSQLEEATKRRSRLTALLSALWREMESLRDDSSRSPRDQSEVLQKIRGLCEEADGAG